MVIASGQCCHGTKNRPQEGNRLEYLQAWHGKILLKSVIAVISDRRMQLLINDHRHVMVKESKYVGWSVKEDESHRWW